jgi:DNA-directed RNA polymerase subunit RPC12/RpoP
MNILKSLFGKPQKPHLIGNTEPVCPYCSAKLDKMPVRKRKCQECGNHFLVRTRPEDRKQVVVTESDAEQIDISWMKVNGTYEVHLAEKRERDEVATALAKQQGRQPTDSDVTWALCNRHLQTHSKNGNWGLYRNVRLEMGDLLRKEKRDQAALEAYLEVSYLDSNGPQNTNGQAGSGVRAFDRTDAFQATGVVRQIAKTAKSLNLSSDDIQQLYREVANRTQRQLKLPTSVDHAWAELQNELSA